MAMDALATRFELGWELSDSDVRPRVAVFASKAPHCLYDLLLAPPSRRARCELPSDRRNHPDPRSVAEHFGVDSSTSRSARETRPSRGRAARRCSASVGIDLVVLARYMQILSPAFVAQLPGAHHQHPPLVLAGVRGRQAVSPGVRARREADRRHRPLRHRELDRGPDHRAGRRPRAATATPSRTSCARARSREAVLRRAVRLPPRAAGAGLGQPDDRVRLRRARRARAVRA